MEGPVFEYRLRKNYDKFLKDLEPKKLVNHLYQDEVFDLDDKEEVTTEKTRKKQADVLLGKILRSGDRNMAIFVNALQKTQRHLYELIQRPVTGELGLLQTQQAAVGAGIEDLVREIRTGMQIHQELPTYIPKALRPHPPLIGNTDKGAAFCQNSEDHELLDPPEDQFPCFVTPTEWGKLPAHIHPQSELVYPMTSKPRGIALIINNERFFGQNPESTEKEQKQQKLDIRLGSETDVKELKELFEALDFQPIIKRNIGRSEILKVLDDVSFEDHSAYDCFVLWLMSHGDDGKFYGADGETVHIETVRDFFNNAKCPTLKGKPKLIFIQACRGLEKEKGVVADSPNSPTRQPSTHGEMPDQELESSDRGFNFHVSKSIPDHADMLIANSTISGYVSFRNELKGSRFVRCIVEVFREFAGHEDLLSMLTMVNKRVSELGEIGSKQVSEPSTTLTKKLYFWPGE